MTYMEDLAASLRFKADQMEDGDYYLVDLLRRAADARDELTKKRQKKGPAVETNLYDMEEIHTHCNVQVLTNSLTGEVSIGWWENERE